MNKVFSIVSAIIIFISGSLTLSAQSGVLDELGSDPRKAYGNDYPYGYGESTLTHAPRGYKPFYISQYARHGSRYFWNDSLYSQLDTLLSTAYANDCLTPEGEKFHSRFMSLKDELTTGVSELTQLGWEQHGQLARTMYANFKELFRKGGDIMAVSSLTGRCVLSMSAFCLEMTRCNPKLKIREQSSRFTLDGVVPDDIQNPKLRKFPKATPRYEQNMSSFKHTGSVLRDSIIRRMFTSTDGLPGNVNTIAASLASLYTSLPSIGHEGLMEGIIADEDLIPGWESSNLGSYSWVFSGKYKMIPILEDIIEKADAAISGDNQVLADLRFGHDGCIGPLTVLMGIAGADLDPEDPYEVKNCYQNWQTCMASNIQLVFYRRNGSKGKDDILVKCLLNGSEVTLPIATDIFPYYSWSALRSLYLERCKAVS